MASFNCTFQIHVSHDVWHIDTHTHIYIYIIFITQHCSKELARHSQSVKILSTGQVAHKISSQGAPSNSPEWLCPTCVILVSMKILPLCKSSCGPIHLLAPNPEIKPHQPLAQGKNLHLRLWYYMMLHEHIYIYILCVCVCMCMYICIYIYIMCVYVYVHVYI